MAGSMPTPKRSETAAGIKQEDGESKKRVRKVEEPGRRGGQRSGEDVLEDRVLTKKVWDEIYDIFKLHFSTEMPFLHPPTFRNRMRQAWLPRDPAAPPPDSNTRILLLGVLTLTARFQPDLIEHHSQSNDPAAASEHYGQALAQAFGPTSRSLANPSLEGIQALLMLALYEWGQTRGLSAWVYIGIATRLAQSMGLPFVDDPKNPVLKSPASNDALKSHTVKPVANPREELTKLEVQRRTWWSCFIMDRMLAAGKRRPTMINVGKLKVQLPGSDDNFLFVRTVNTGFLKSSWLREEKPADGSCDDDNVLSWYIRAIEIFGRFVEWSYTGGRRTEQLPPWDTSTEFCKLRHELDAFHQALPSNLTFTEANLQAHIEKRNATAYASMHTMHLMCLIMLHREYLPFVPLRISKPSGPLDEPKFPPNEYDTPENFWEESAELIFKAARDIIKLVKTCKEEDALPRTPQVLFALYQASFFASYAFFFPHMDTGGHLQDAGAQDPERVHSTYSEFTSNMLRDLVPKLKMAKGYKKKFDRTHANYRRFKYDFYLYELKKQPVSWTGGAADRYLRAEKDLKEFGSLSDGDRNQHSDGSDAPDQPRSRASTNDLGQSSSVNGDSMQGVEAAPTSRPNGGAWAAINTNTAGSPPQEAEERVKYQSYAPYGTPGQNMHHGLSYQQSPVPSNVPSLASPSNGDSSSMPSPYATQTPQFHGGSQAQHAAAYPSIAQHTNAVMRPPNPIPDAAQAEAFSHNLDTVQGVGFNAMRDNFGQDDGLYNLNSFNYENFSYMQHAVMPGGMLSEDAAPPYIV